jgi:hypothetical protein
MRFYHILEKEVGITESHTRGAGPGQSNGRNTGRTSEDNAAAPSYKLLAEYTYVPYGADIAYI